VMPFVVNATAIKMMASAGMAGYPDERETQ
jgi:hypothetical protein